MTNQIQDDSESDYGEEGFHGDWEDVLPAFARNAGVNSAEQLEAYTQLVTNTTHPALYRARDEAFSFAQFSAGPRPPAPDIPSSEMLTDIAQLRAWVEDPLTARLLNMAFVPLDTRRLPADSHCAFCGQGWMVKYHWPVLLRCGHMLGQFCIIKHIHDRFSIAATSIRLHGGVSAYLDCTCPAATAEGTCDAKFFPFAERLEAGVGEGISEALFYARHEGPFLDWVFRTWARTPQPLVVVDARLFNEHAFDVNVDLSTLAQQPLCPKKIQRVVTLDAFHPCWAVQGMIDFFNVTDGRVVPLDRYFHACRRAIYGHIYTLHELSVKNTLGAGENLPGGGHVLVAIPPKDENPLVVGYIDGLIIRTLAKARMLQKIAI